MDGFAVGDLVLVCVREREKYRDIVNGRVIPVGLVLVHKKTRRLKLVLPVHMKFFSNPRES